ncbi:MAG: hypothetical protein QM766_19680 [Burkholderiaceae bacterium]
MNRVRNSGIAHPVPYFSDSEGLAAKAKLDRYLDKKMEEWRQNVPYASHMAEKKIHLPYYRRTLIEHVWRIRLSRVSQTKAIYKIAQISPRAAQDYAHYQADEMLHDKLYIRDCESVGITMDEILATEPYLSTRLFQGFFYYAIEHEHPMAPVVSNYLVEYTQAKLQPKFVRALKESMGHDSVKGQEAHLAVDSRDDHSMEMWKILNQLILSEEDYAMVFRYIDDVQSILELFFREIHKDTVVEPSSPAASRAEALA